MSVDLLSESLTVIPHQDLISDFEYHLRWNSIQDSFSFASFDTILLLDRLCIPSSNFSVIGNGFSQGTISVVSDRSFCIYSLFGPSETSSVIVPPEIDYNQNL